MTRRIAIYARCSTEEQTTENQIRELHAVASRHGWDVVAVFDDNGVSGGVPRGDRPAMTALLRAVARREVDMVAAWAVDRLGRSLIDPRAGEVGHDARQGRRHENRRCYRPSCGGWSHEGGSATVYKLGFDA